MMQKKNGLNVRSQLNSKQTNKVTEIKFLYLYGNKCCCFTDGLTLNYMRIVWIFNIMCIILDKRAFRSVFVFIFLATLAATAIIVDCFAVAHTLRLLITNKHTLAQIYRSRVYNVMASISQLCTPDVIYMRVWCLYRRSAPQFESHLDISAIWILNNIKRSPFTFYINSCDLYFFVFIFHFGI